MYTWDRLNISPPYPRALHTFYSIFQLWYFGNFLHKLSRVRWECIGGMPMAISGSHPRPRMGVRGQAWVFWLIGFVDGIISDYPKGRKYTQASFRRWGFEPVSEPVVEGNPTPTKQRCLTLSNTEEINHKSGDQKSTPFHSYMWNGQLKRLVWFVPVPKSLDRKLRIKCHLFMWRIVIHIEMDSTLYLF